MSLSSGQILAKAYKRQRKSSPAYSLRRLAMQLQVSPSFVCAIFQGQRLLPPRLLSKISMALGMDDLAEEALRATLAKEKVPKEFRRSNPSAGRLPPLQPHEEMSRAEFSLLNRWYFLPLLDLTTCENFVAEPSWIAKRLGIPVSEARQAWEFVRGQKYVKWENGVWRKWAEHIRFPSQRSDPAIRSYHAQTLGLARRELEKIKDSDFSQRLIMGASLAVNPDRLQEAKLALQAAIVEISKSLSEGSCAEVYQLQVQLFPVTKDTR